MDSITQAVLGAAVADLTMGRQLNRRAALWGLALGTLPDLDVVVIPLLSTAEVLEWHRGVSHGLLAIVLVSPLIGWLLHKYHEARGLSWRRASIAVGLVLLTHVLIDCFNLYGAGIWEPFSNDWLSFKLMFIIDPLFTLPLLLATVIALTFSSQHSWRLPLTWICVGISCCYIGWAVTAKTIINQRFSTSLEQISDAQISVQEWHSAPLPLTTVLWRCLVKVEREGRKGFLIGIASLMDDDPRVVWRWVPQVVEPHYLNGEENPKANKASSSVADKPMQSQWNLSEEGHLSPDHKGFKTAQWFSKGNWVLILPSEPDQLPVVHDIRFGSMQLDLSPIDPATHPWAFSWRLKTTPEGEKDLEPITSLMRDPAALPSLWSRLLGERYDWELAALDESLIIDSPLLKLSD